MLTAFMNKFRRYFNGFANQLLRADGKRHGITEDARETALEFTPHKRRTNADRCTQAKTTQLPQ